ncbi:MAG TPA: DUF2934 domain-containing protein [Candidatus Thermoplasmatota archaeon]|nr:DUF2934 domain-containing protein [Candidatus Thermoplasmatota archaeon]
MVTSRPATGTTSSGVRVPIDADIRRRAYELYEGRGRTPGHEVDDWVQAERELRLREEAGR